MGVGEGQNIVSSGHRRRHQNLVAEHECNLKHLTGLPITRASKALTHMAA